MVLNCIKGGGFPRQTTIMHNGCVAQCFQATIATKTKTTPIRYCHDCKTNHPVTTTVDEMGAFLKNQRSTAVTSFSVSLVTCGICYDDVKPIALASFCFADCCDMKYCKGCVHDYVTTKVRNSEIDMVMPCPCSQGKGKMKGTLIEADLGDLELDDAVMDRIGEIRLEKEVMRDPTRCFCPTPSCGQILTGNKWVKKVKCKEGCKTSICFRCKGAWKFGHNCRRHGLSKRIGLIGKDANTCPRCEVMIEKNGGCQSVTCTACDFQFCWWCRQSHAGHTHKNSMAIAACAPLALLRNKHPYWGPGLIRPVTKIVAVVTVATLAATVVVIGTTCVATAAVTSPIWYPLKRYHSSGARYRRQQRREEKARRKAWEKRIKKQKKKKTNGSNVKLTDLELELDFIENAVITHPCRNVDKNPTLLKSVMPELVSSTIPLDEIELRLESRVPSNSLTLPDLATATTASSTAMEVVSALAAVVTEPYEQIKYLFEAADGLLLLEENKHMEEVEADAAGTSSDVLRMRECLLEQITSSYGKVLHVRGVETITSSSLRSISHSEEDRAVKDPAALEKHDSVISVN